MIMRVGLGLGELVGGGPKVGDGVPGGTGVRVGKAMTVLICKMMSVVGDGDGVRATGLVGTLPLSETTTIAPPLAAGRGVGSRICGWHAARADAAASATARSTRTLATILLSMPAVLCARCGKQAQGLDQAPMSGQLGQDLLQRVCGECWKEWTQESYRIINHHGLQPVDPADREKLRGFMREYFKLA